MARSDAETTVIVAPPIRSDSPGGHPVGMSGARLILTLLRQIKHETGGGLGLGTLCVGGGQGGAALVGSDPWKS